MAGQHPRAAEHDRARRYPHADRQPDYAGEPVRWPAAVGTATGGGDRLQALVDAALTDSVALPEVERRLLETAVERSRGNLSGAARSLGITRPQLAYRLRKHQS